MKIAKWWIEPDRRYYKKYYSEYGRLEKVLWEIGGRGDCSREIYKIIGAALEDKTWKKIHEGQAK